MIVTVGAVMSTVSDWVAVPMFPAVFRYLALPFLVAAAIAAIGFRQPHIKSAHIRPTDNPLQLRAALQMALMFQVVLMLVHLVRRVFRFVVIENDVGARLREHLDRRSANPPRTSRNQRSLASQ